MRAANHYSLRVKKFGALCRQSAIGIHAVLLSEIDWILQLGEYESSRVAIGHGKIYGCVFVNGCRSGRGKRNVYAGGSCIVRAFRNAIGHAVACGEIACERQKVGRTSNVAASGSIDLQLDLSTLGWRPDRRRIEVAQMTMAHVDGNACFAADVRKIHHGYEPVASVVPGTWLMVPLRVVAAFPAACRSSLRVPPAIGEMLSGSFSSETPAKVMLVGFVAKSSITKSVGANFKAWFEARSVLF